jgi:hypothetical protein
MAKCFGLGIVDSQRNSDKEPRSEVAVRAFTMFRPLLQPHVRCVVLLLLCLLEFPCRVAQ